ncbi:MAG: hypothetical protein KAJ53_00255 [Anaerolineales bacterium]|nr:hypothetical protein [Anaerolineales bacterium]
MPGQLLEVGVLGIEGDQLVQPRSDSDQLLVADQPTPIERLSAAAVERIPDRQADLGFNGPKLRVSWWLVNS